MAKLFYYRDPVTSCNWTAVAENLQCSTSFDIDLREPLLPETFISYSNPVSQSFPWLSIFRNSACWRFHTTPFQYPMTPELRAFVVTTNTEIPLLPSILHFLSAETRYFVTNQETFGLIMVLKIEWYRKGMTLRVLSQNKPVGTSVE